MEIDRYDGDAALNYKINDYFKIFIGTKYLGYEYTLEFNYNSGTPQSMTADVEHKGFGPGGGISSVIPLGSDFYLLSNVSTMYLRGEEKVKNKTTDPSVTFDPVPAKKYKEYGINIGLSFAYYIPAASTTISLGGRYQAYTTKYDKKIQGNDGIVYDTDKNKFWGVTLSAAYSFSI